MLYKISLIINTAISVLIIIFCCFGIATDTKTEPDVLIGVSLFFLLFLIFIWFNIICFKVNRSNKENNLVSHAVQKTGSILFVFNILAIVVSLICLVASLFSLSSIRSLNANPASWGFYIVFMFLFFLLAVTAIINTVFFKRAIKKNKLLVADFINDIGEKI
jgi:magnesium-transporting ATPase (P-type)